MPLSAIHALDYAFVDHEPETSATDHLASGLIPTAIAALLIVCYPRVRADARATLALFFGAVAMGVGCVTSIRHIGQVGLGGDDLTGALTALSGLALVSLGAITLWRPAVSTSRQPAATCGAFSRLGSP